MASPGNRHCANCIGTVYRILGRSKAGQNRPSCRVTLFSLTARTVLDRTTRA